MVEYEPVFERMQSLVDDWQATADRRAAFLSCYQMMTSNMHQAIDGGEFNDPEWVYSLLQQFAGYYFHALEAYEANQPDTPAIWRQAFDATRQPDTRTLQNLLLGMNAHINYDLIFTLVDMLEPEWAQLSSEERQGRYDDHCHVNAVIHRTIDAVQDTIIEPDEPLMELADRLMGEVDEWIVARLITQWRDEVWEQAQCLLDSPSSEERLRLQQIIEDQALRRAANILLNINQKDTHDSIPTD
jgi:hypothetical protein